MDRFIISHGDCGSPEIVIPSPENVDRFIISHGDCGPPEIVFTWSGKCGQIHHLTWGLWSTGNCYTWSGKRGQIHNPTWGLWSNGNCLYLVRKMWTYSSSKLGTAVHRVFLFFFCLYRVRKICTDSHPTWKLWSTGNYIYLVRKMWADSSSHIGTVVHRKLYIPGPENMDRFIISSGHCGPSEIFILSPENVDRFIVSSGDCGPPEIVMPSPENVDIFIISHGDSGPPEIVIPSPENVDRFIVSSGDSGPPEIVYTWSGKCGRIHHLIWGSESPRHCFYERKKIKQLFLE